MLVCNVLKRLDSGKLDTFDDRLTTQKKQYLAQLFGVSINYEYNLYWHGPYSPDLTNDLFFMMNNKSTIEITKFASEEKEDALLRLREFLKDKTLHDLEVITTLHWLKNVAKLPDAAAEERLKQLKKPSAPELTRAWAALKVLP
jgi:uncharacterized protein YwgA